ncbi:MAG TPA: hypothetical protein VHE78_05390 [Gemmatimonadaceae bacterium]|nr:hypothetical protein [Gemmatimonadaceae bacterium]
MTVADRLRAIVDALPDGSAVTLNAAALRAWLVEEPEPRRPAVVIEPITWKERLWTCPLNTRLGMRELCEALGRSPDWVYRAVAPKRAAARGREPLPCSRLDGVLVFEVGAIRRWLEAAELVKNPERTLRLTRPTRHA